MAKKKNKNRLQMQRKPKRVFGRPGENPHVIQLIESAALAYQSENTDEFHRLVGVLAEHGMNVHVKEDGGLSFTESFDTDQLVDLLNQLPPP